jgi:type IX secretion system PorP/SprF family membrane protein
MRVFLAIQFLFINLLSVSAQTGAGLPVQFMQFFKTYNLVNPAATGRDSSLQINTGNKSLLGAFAGVRTFYVNGNIQLGCSKRKTSRHILGANFINDKEGTYINKNRASLTYAVSIRLGSRTSLNAGLAAGFINYSYKATDINGGGSAFAPNADLGLWLQRSDFNIGISSDQILPSKLTPIDETYTISRYYNLLADKTIKINYFLALRPAFSIRWLNKNIYNIDLALLSLIRNNFIAGLTYKYQKGISICTGLDRLRFKNEVFKFMFSYYYPSNRLTYYNSSSVEISLGFLLSKPLKVEESE